VNGLSHLLFLCFERCKKLIKNDDGPDIKILNYDKNTILKPLYDKIILVKSGYLLGLNHYARKCGGYICQTDQHLIKSF
jgi:hypothetical protein